MYLGRSQIVDTKHDALINTKAISGHLFHKLALLRSCQKFTGSKLRVRWRRKEKTSHRISGGKGSSESAKYNYNSIVNKIIK